MSEEYVIADLRKQREQLDHLISRLRQKDQLNQDDLQDYDQTTKRIEKRLRTLINQRRIGRIPHEV